MIKSSLWKRMVFGYAVIALFMLVMNFYLIFRLNHLNKHSASIMRSDIPYMENSEKLFDILLEQVKNEKKYIITGDHAFLDLFQDKKRDFDKRLKSLDETATDAESRPFVSQLKNLYHEYVAMVSKEFLLVGGDENASPDPRYEHEKKKKFDQLTESINKLIVTQQAALIKKIELFQKTVRKSTQISTAITGFAVLFGAIFAYFFTRSICYPIKVIKDATDGIAQGNLDCHIRVASRDEIGMLGLAFNHMCDRLKELDRMKAEFISNISHNLKTPLTAIREANELMLDKVAGQVSDQQARLLTIVKESTLRLIMMINDLLDISRVEAGLMRYNFQITMIKDIILRSIHEIRLLAESKNIKIQYVNGDPVPEVPLDRNKIAQVMDNILSNAIKFTPSGGMITITHNEIAPSVAAHVSLEQKRINNVNSFVQVSISDTGIGIPVEYHQKIFDKFQQVDNKGIGGMKGTGLGLSIAKHIVLDHGGNIWVENNNVKGSTFHFTLPCKVDYGQNL
ncbi:MAG: ATP-binding protein [Planctomycetota bacterium]